MTIKDYAYRSILHWSINQQQILLLATCFTPWLADDSNSNDNNDNNPYAGDSNNKNSNNKNSHLGLPMILIATWLVCQ